METKLVCSECGSDKILMTYWHDPNTGDCKGWTEDEMCYCTKCDKMTLWEEKTL